MNSVRDLPVYDPFQKQNIGRRTGKVIQLKSGPLTSIEDFFSDSESEVTLNITRQTPSDAKSTTEESNSPDTKNKSSRVVPAKPVLEDGLKNPEKKLAPKHNPGTRIPGVFDPFANSRYGRRTGKDVFAGKKKLLQSNGVGNLSDFFSDSDASSTLNPTPNRSPALDNSFSSHKESEDPASHEPATQDKRKILRKSSARKSSLQSRESSLQHEEKENTLVQDEGVDEKLEKSHRKSPLAPADDIAQDSSPLAISDSSDQATKEADNENSCSNGSVHKEKILCTNGKESQSDLKTEELSQNEPQFEKEETVKDKSLPLDKDVASEGRNNEEHDPQPLEQVQGDAPMEEEDASSNPDSTDFKVPLPKGKDKKKGEVSTDLVVNDKPPSHGIDSEDPLAACQKPNRSKSKTPTPSRYQNVKGDLDFGGDATGSVSQADKLAGKQFFGIRKRLTFSKAIAEQIVHQETKQATETSPEVCDEDVNEDGDVCDDFEIVDVDEIVTSVSVSSAAKKSQELMKEGEPKNSPEEEHISPSEKLSTLQKSSDHQRKLSRPSSGGRKTNEKIQENRRKSSSVLVTRETRNSQKSVEDEERKKSLEDMLSRSSEKLSRLQKSPDRQQKLPKSSSGGEEVNEAIPENSRKSTSVSDTIGIKRCQKPVIEELNKEPEEVLIRPSGKLSRLRKSPHQQQKLPRSSSGGEETNEAIPENSRKSTSVSDTIGIKRCQKPVKEEEAKDPEEVLSRPSEKLSTLRKSLGGQKRVSRSSLDRTKTKERMRKSNRQSTPEHQLQPLAMLPRLTPKSGVSFRSRSSCFALNPQDDDEPDDKAMRIDDELLSTDEISKHGDDEDKAELSDCRSPVFSRPTVSAKRQRPTLRKKAILNRIRGQNREETEVVDLSLPISDQEGGDNSTMLPSPSSAPVHYQETTMSNRRSSFLPVPDLSDRIVYPEVSDNGLRRSKRTKVKRLNRAIGEGIVYRRDSTGSGLLVDRVETSHGAVQFLRMEKERQRKKTKRKFAIKTVPAKTKRLSSHCKLQKDLTESTEIPIINPETKETVCIELFSQSNSDKWTGPDLNPVTNMDPVAICQRLNQPIFGTGELHMKPFSDKPLQLAVFTVIFLVTSGKISVRINGVTTVVQAGDDFFIPRGSQYSLQNLRNDIAKIRFVNLKDDDAYSHSLF